MKINFVLIIEKYNQQDIKIRYAVFGGILLCIFLLDYFTLIGFQWSSLSAMSSQNQEFKNNIDRLKTDLQRIDQMKVGLQNAHHQLEAMNMKVRSANEVSAIVEDISQTAHDTDVTINQITPQRELQQPLMNTKEVKYSALPIVIQANSGYHMFGHFINRLELGNLFFSLSNLTIESNSSGIHHAINATLKVVLSDKNMDDQKK